MPVWASGMTLKIKVFLKDVMLKVKTFIKKSPYFKWKSNIALPSSHENGPWNFEDGGQPDTLTGYDIETKGISD